MSGPWEKFASGPWQRFSAAPQGRLDAAALAFGQGATFNAGDEFAATMRAWLPQFSDMVMRQPETAFGATPDADGFVQSTRPTSQTTSKAETWQERYEAELAKTRGQLKANKEAHPNLTTAGEIAGNVATTAAALPAAMTAMGPNLVTNMAKLGATGAVLGGAQGFADGEGEEDRINKGTTGAVVGGGVGAATPVVGLGLRALGESALGRWVGRNIAGPMAQRVASIFEGQRPAVSLSAAAPDGTQGVMGPLTQASEAIADPARAGAIERLAVAAQRSGMSHEQFLRRLDQLGPEAMLADLDPQFLSQARMAHTMPGQTRTLAPIALEGRDRQAGNRLVAAFEGSEPPPSSFALRGEGQAFDQHLRAVGNRVYGDMAEAGLRQTPELMAIYENPSVAAAIDKVMTAEKATRQGTNRAPASPIEIMHKVKQAIWDLGFDKDTARPGPMASWYRDLGVEYMNRLKRANPALAEADIAYAQAASLPDFFDAGRSFLARGSSEKATNNSAPALADLLASSDPQQRIAARAGSTNAAREAALEGTRAARALAQRIDESTPVQEKIGQLYGPQAGRIARQASAERQFAETSNEVLRGSKTADKVAEILDSGGGSPIRPDVTRSNVLVRAIEGINALDKYANEAVRDRIGQMTLRTDPEENRRILRAIADELARRSGGAPARAGLAVGASGASQ